MTTGANRLFGGADTIFAFAPEKLLDDAVFQRMEADHREPAAGTKQAGGTA